MAKRPTANHIRGLLDELEPSIRDAFEQGVNNIRLNSGLNRKDQAAMMARLEEAIKQGNVDEAARAINLDPSAFRQLSKSVSDVYEAGGDEAARRVPKITQNNGSTALFRFDIEHPTAAQDLRQHSSTLITGIVEDQRQVIRDVLADGIQKGRAPRRTALDLVGRVDKITGQRSGGVIGLSSVQARYVETMRERLLSGDPKEMEKVFGMSRRDKRFDATIRTAIRDGKPLDAVTVTRLTTRYSDRLLQLRGETIARTETMSAFNKGQMASMQQAINEGRVSASVVVKEWHAFLDERTRFSHRELNNTVVGFYDMFETPRGRFMAYPGDFNGGAEECVNCFAPWTRISPAGLVAAVAHEYSGDLVELSVGGDVYLSITPYHPVLTHRGWMPAGHVMEGDQLIDCRVGDLRVSSEPDVGNADPRADELYDAAKAVGTCMRTSRGVVNFHGHVPGHDVDVISLPRKLRDALQPALLEAFGDITLAETDVPHGRLVYDRLIKRAPKGNAFSTNSFMRLRSAITALFRRGERCAPSVPFRHGRERDAEIFEAGVNSAPGRPYSAGYSEDRVAFVKKLLHAIKVLTSPFRVPSRGRASFRGVSSFAGNWDKAQIRNAAFDQSIRNPDLSSNPANRQPVIVEQFHLIQEGRSSKPPRFDRAQRNFSSVSVSHVRRVPYEGLVYDFQTQNGLIMADNIVVHNCRCWLDVKIDFLADIE